MFLPNRIRLSRRSTNRLQHIKNKTGVTPNITSRIAMLLAIRSNDDINNAGVDSADGQELNKDILFGENIEVYEVLIKQYMNNNKIDMSVAKVIASLVELGAHKMGHIKTLEQLCELS
tara:strand:- start:162 stop:515 length:354 start_codon:yes stop_codon:yes gene_type:complete